MKNKPAVQIQQKRITLLMLTCFFLSGLTALIYEIVWMRFISKIIGSGPFAVSTILVVFMGGMGLGSYISSRKADRIKETSLIRIYGVLELAIGLYGLLVPSLLMLFEKFFSFLYNNFYEYTIFYNFLVFSASLVLLGIPVVCMGATLPLLCKYYVRNLSHVGTNSGRLYGLNTIGAAAGSLLCGFVLLNNLGIWGTMILAVSINCAIGFSCLAAGYKAAPADQGVQRHSADSANSLGKGLVPPTDMKENRAEMRGSLIIFFVSGFCAMAYEVFWTKLLGLIVGPTTYSFTIVLVSFITGLAIGNMFFGRAADRTGNTIRLLITTQVLAAFLALAVSQMLGDSQLFFAKLIYAFRDNFLVQNFIKAAILFAFMILPTFFLGAAFPLVAKLYTPSLSGIGRSVGVAYAVNTAGAVLGSFGAGFLLIPLVGKETGLSLIVAVQIITSIGVGFIIQSRRGARSLQMALPAAALIAGIYLCFSFPSWNRHLLSSGKYHRFEDTAALEESIQGTGWITALFKGSDILAKFERGKLIYYGDGIGGFTTVLKYPGPLGDFELSMANSGKMDASTRGDMKTQTLLAHFPMIFCPEPRAVMVLGLASGITAGEILHYPVERLDVVDINDRVFEACGYFTAWNNGVLSSPRCRLINQDGIAHLTLTKTKYDVIISEPSNPWMAGMASLFTKDFFSLAKNRLTEGGIYVQWFHCYQMDWPSFALVGRTFSEAFPNGILVAAEPSGTGMDYLFIGFNAKSGLNLNHAMKNIVYARKSKNINLSRPELLYRLIVSEDLSSLFGRCQINTDDRPLLEYASPKLMYHDEKMRKTLIYNINGNSRLNPETTAVITRLKQDIDAQIDFAAYVLSVHSPFINMVDLTRASRSQRDRFTRLMESYCVNNVLDFDLFDDRALLSRLRAVQITAIKEKIHAMPDKALSNHYLARLYLLDGRADEAISSYARSIEADPDDAQVHNDLGFLYYQRGDIDKAMAHYTRALQIRPNFMLTLGNLAYLNLGRGRFDEAMRWFEETLRIKPDLAESHYNIGYIHFKNGNHRAAAGCLREALERKPDMVEALNTLAWILATTDDGAIKNPPAAVQYAMRACELTDNKDPMTLATLAVSYAAAGESTKSAGTAESALKLARETGKKEIAEMLEKHILRLK